MKFFNQKNWNDPFKWKMDLIKFFITAILTVFGIRTYERFLAKEDFKQQSDFATKLAALREFEKNSYLYSKETYDALKETTRCGQFQNNQRIVNWEDNSFDNFTYSLESLEYWFTTDSRIRCDATILDKTELLLSVNKNIYSLYKRIQYDSTGRQKIEGYCKSIALMDTYWSKKWKSKAEILRKDFEDVRFQVLGIAKEKLEGN